ncbi:hypothetical protein L1999_20100 [Neobacillus drentensis]|uniref:hypothetical protein n=1 Tax=Neobacillus drentensis TaxID=220684 RepID=UPI001F3396A0|nr:hypothetical protein [Neobacillus drentensis]ULT55388.1 hypothetical protein L1999_20100 [Neobacillus drentensis]
MLKHEYINKIKELIHIGYTKQDLYIYLNVKRKQQVMSRYQQLINDALDSNLQSHSYYAGLFGISIQMVSSDYKILIRKANWLNNYRKEKGEIYKGEINVRVKNKAPLK